MNITDIDIYVNKLTQTIVTANKNILEKYPVDQVIRSIIHFQLPNNYTNILEDSNSLLSGVESEYAPEMNTNYSKLIICKLIQSSFNELIHSNYPADIIALYKNWFQSILQDLDKSDFKRFHYKNDIFVKDINICSLKMFPNGGQIVDTSAISKRFIASGNLNQNFKAGLFYFLEMGGNQPFYQFHYDYRCRRGFTPDGWKKSFLNTAEMLKLNPSIKGTFAASWFFDPHLENISPELNFLRTIPLENGAKIFKIGSREIDIANATSKSKIRTDAYHKGSYIPTCNILIWPRKKLLNWASKF